MAQVDEIVDGIYRIATTVQLPGGNDFTFNQFLIDDERPALIHTGMHELYEGVRDGVAEVVLARETIPDFVRALREEPFAYEGKLLGRELA